MDNKGFIDEINPMFIALALIGAVVVFFMMKQLDGLTFWKVVNPIATFIVVYLYLAFTDN